MKRSNLKRAVINTIGWLTFLVGAIGMIVPLLPTTVFWLIALWCFARTSPKMQAWLRQHPTLGRTLSDFVDHGVICRRGKYFAIGGIFLAWACLAG